MNELRLKRGLWLLALILALAACSAKAPPASESEATENTAVAEANPTAAETVQEKEVAAPTTEPSPTEAPIETPTDEPSPTEAPTATAVSTATTEPEPVEPGALAEAYAEYELVTLLPQDAIPAIDDPQFLTVEEADQFYDPSEFIIGVSINGDTRAYSIPLLSSHEVVNDTVGGRQIAVTW